MGLIERLYCPQDKSQAFLRDRDGKGLRQRAFDFAGYDIGIITVEHNYTPNRQLLHQLLVANGYERKFEALSQWDDWYVRTRR